MSGGAAVCSRWGAPATERKSFCNLTLNHFIYFRRPHGLAMVPLLLEQPVVDLSLVPQEHLSFPLLLLPRDLNLPKRIKSFIQTVIPVNA